MSSQTQIQEFVLNSLKKYTHDEISQETILEKTFSDIAIDSLDLFEFISEIEDNFNIEIDEGLLNGDILIIEFIKVLEEKF